jgi:phage baseplate assembly protein W
MFKVGLQIIGSPPQGLGPINWSPAQGTADEILQNVKMILLTPIGSQVFDRALGVRTDFVDQAMPVGMAMVQSLFAMAIRQFEPRFLLDNISFSDPQSGANGTVTALVIGHLDITVANPVIPQDFVAGSGTATFVVDTTGDTPGIYQEVVSS